MTGGDYIEFTNCTFENCTSGTNGGGVDWLAGANYGKVIDCNFTNTRAARSAGAIYYDGDYGEMRNIIIRNATSYGGAINESGDTLVKYACWDLSHWDTNTTGGDAGAIMFTGNHVSVYNVNVTDCTAADRGGAVFLQDNHNVTFELCWFENNCALGIANNTYNDPYNTSSGLNHELTGAGGAIGFDVGATESSIIASTFINNYALNYGGAVHFRQGASEDKIINSTFDKNHANEDGGALFIDGDDCELHNSTFDDNYAGDDGGAIFWKGQGGTIYNITCNNNSGLSTHGNSKGGTICLTGNDISLSDSSFKQSYAKVTGGAIFVTGNNVNITGSDFKDCNVSDSTGGALHLLGNSTLVRDCTFEECHADTGSAVYTEGNYIKIINSTFNNNNGTGDGGALYVLGHHSELHNSTFTNNFAGDDGGAIYWDGDKGTIYNITCENNKGISFNESNSKGGTICLTGDDVTISNSTFKNTSAKDDGGAIFVSGDNVDIIASEFEYCNSTAYGGAIYVQGDNTDIIDSKFEKCNATLGGAIYVEGDGATISAEIINTQALGKESYNITIDRKYYKDTLKEIGFDIEDIIEYLNNVTFENVTAENVKTLNNTLNALKDITGHILVGDGVNTTNITIALDLVNKLIGNLTQINSTLSDGGDKNITLKLLREVSAVGDELTDLYDVSQNMELPGDMKKQVDDMIAYLDTVVPGTISTADIDTLNKTLKDIEQAIEKIVISGAFNSSSIDVALSLIDDLNAKLTAIDPQHTLTGLDCTEVVNELNNLSKFAESLVVPETDGRGGAIYISGNGATIHDSEMSYTTAVDGGAVFITGDDVTVTNSYFHNLKAVEDGGAIYITGQRGKLYNSNFTNNTVGDDGGAIYWEGNYGDIYNIICENNNGTGDGLGNHSSTKGGTMIINGYHTTVSKSSFANSYAAILGGTIYVTGNDVNITDSSFKNSTVGNNTGGAIHILGNGTGILNCIIEDTFAPENGGAIFVEGNNATITAKFRNTNATTSGGSIYVDGNNTWIINSTFDNTYAFGHDGNGGGAIYVEGQSATIEKSNFTHTYANRNNLARGGAIFIHGNNTDVIESNFKEAHSNIQGGAIYVNGINATINGSQFDTCSVNSPGSEGGAIYIKGENTTVEGSNFINSTSVLNGGAIYINGLNAAVKDSNFTDSSVTGNSGTPSGGAIYIQEDYASIDGSIFKHSTVPNSIGQGGTIFIDGNHTIIKSSVFESSSAKTGGTLYLEGNNCTVSDSSFNDSYAKTNGGAMYSTGSNSTVSNSNFTNNLAEESGGALYWFGGAHSKYNTVDGCIFTNNTAHGNTTFASQTRGGGAIYWSENGEYGTVKNSEFYYNSVQSTIDKKVDGGAILWDKSYHALVDNCRFVGNFVTTNGDSKQPASAAEWDWAQGGAMYLRPNNNYTVKNCLFENCSSSKEAGALYIQGKTTGTDHMITLENCKFINNVAEAKGKDTNGLINGGGAIQIKQCTNSDFKNLTFINNTANKGGALCVFDSVTNLVVDGANFTGNKADRGSAISASKGFTLKNAVLLENRATTATFDLTFNRDNNGSIDILLEGKDNRLNAMYVSVDGINVKCNNVTYWTNNNISIGKTAVTNANQGYTALPVPEAGISVTVEIFDGDNNKLHEGIYATDGNGKIHLDIGNILTPPYSTDNIYVNARLTNEDYYTMAERTSRFQNVYIINPSALDTIFHRNTTVTAEIFAPNNGTGHAANGTISIYFDGEFVGNMTVENSKGILENIPARLGTDGKFLEVGNHTVFLKYWGDANFDVANTTFSLNVTKAQSNLTVGFNDVGYDLYVNVTIFDEFDDKAYWDANGTATVKFYSENNPTVLVRSAEVKIINGYGQTMIPDLLPRNYTVITTFHGDNNYNSSVNSTRYALLQKQFAAVFVEVNAYDIMVNDTIYINVTIVPPDGYNVPGNVTLYLDNQGYNLTLIMGPHNATAKFNITNLTAGAKKVVVFYEGSKLLEPAKGEADFRVHKYNTTISANVTNITHIQKEIINITLLNDTTGVVSVFVDGKEYIGRIDNGTVSIELPQLAVGEYNVTVYYEGDGKYNNATNKTTFYVTKVTPEMIIDIENVTYGDSTHIIVTLPECTEGSVSIEIDGTPFDVPKAVKDGRVEFVVEYLTAGNYTLKATYTGDVNHTAVSGEQKFKVYKANRTIIIEVQNITYGEIEHIKVFVNATGNVTIFVDGRNETIELNESNVPATILRAIVNAISEYKGKAALDVYNLNVGVYPVDVIYHGNANYNEASAKATFIVSQVKTSLVIDTHNVPVWYNEYLNVTVRTSTGGIAVNATGNITIYIDGERHSAKIIDGVARFNITTSHVGQKVVWAFYEGDINFVRSESMKTFEVQQRTLFMNVTANNITVGQNGNITVELPENATGHVVIEVVGDNTYIAYANHGHAAVYPKNLKEGTYLVNVEYFGDNYDNYHYRLKETYFIVSKSNTAVEIDVNSTVYGNKVNITVKVDDGVEGNITIKLNNTEIGTYGIVGGWVNITVDNLAAGNYTVYTSYSGNSEYNINSTSKGFEVTEVISAITIERATADAATNATIVVRINETATGNITITVNGTKYNATIENGVAIFTINKLPAGKYDITAEYIGDGNNTPVASTTLVDGLTVTKVDCYQINVTANDTKVDLNTTIVVKVPVDAVGNVSICIDGVVKYNATVNQGVAEWNVTMPYGNHTVNVTFTDGKYGFRYATTDYWVFKHDAPLDINVASIYVGDTAYINVTAPTDNVTIEINGKSYNRVKYENGIAYFKVSGLEYGNKTVVAIYGGSDKYLRNATTDNFTVNKRSTGINITVEDITYGGKVNITVNVTREAKGFITLRINETMNVTLPIENGKVNWIVEGLGVENYTVYAIYSGDEKYNINSTNNTFKVTKAISAITIEESTADAATNATIVVRISETATGNITITVNGTKYNATIENGVVIFTINKLLAGKYNITAEYIGDDNNTPVTSTTLVDGLTITKVDCYQINVTANDTKVGLNTTIVVKVPVDAVGNVSICIDGVVKYNATVNQGVAEWNVTMPYGNHTVNVTFTDGKYGFRYATTDYWVFKHESPLTIDVDSIYVGDTAYINVTAPTGDVTIEINGKSYSKVKYENGIAYFEVSDLAYGNKTVVAIYAGDSKYVASSTTENFTVSKRDSVLDVVATGNSVGNNAIITVNVTNGATGYVVVNVNGTNYTINLTGSRGSVEIAGLGDGDYYVHATYIGDDKYKSSINNTEAFTMTKSDVIMNITVESIDYGQKANITVNITSDATGFITIRINNTRNITLPIDNGKVNWIVDGLAADNYTVYANYSGDGKYNLNNTDKVNKSFEVRQISPNVDIIKVTAEAGKNATIIIKVDSRTTENITVNVNRDYSIKPNAEGIAVVVTDVLENGTYTVTVSYPGDKNFTSGGAQVDVVTNKTSDYSINVTAGDIKVEEDTNIVVNVPADAKGIVIVDINGTNYTARIVQGKAVFNNNTVGLSAGRYNITAYFGNGKYENKTATGVFYINKHDSPIAIDVDSILVGDTAYINVTAPTDNVSVEINGKFYNKVKYENGIAYFEVSDLAYGNKTVVAVYGGNNKYLANSTTENFTVSKRVSQVNVTATGNAVGSNAIISVNVTDTATGYVVVNVNGTNYTINLTGSRGSIQIDGLKAGTYYVHATYIGDDKYKSSMNNTQTFTMTKSDVIMNITVDSIDYGQKANITVNITSDATGFITIRINNTRNITLPIDNGKVNWIVDGLAADNYTVWANYSGDVKYNLNNTDKVNESFEVRQISPNIRIVYVDSIAGENATVIVTIDSRATGNVNVNVDRDYIKQVGDGIIIITTDKLAYGTYVVNASYIGDKNFTKDNITFTFTTNKTSDYKLNITTADINIGDLTDITVNVPVDARGIVILEIENHNYTAVINGGKAVFRNQTNLGAGRYNVTAYFGDDKYANKTATGIFTINKLQTPIEIKVDPIYVGDKAIINVTVPKGVSENVTIEIDGIKYNKTVDANGSAIFEVQILSNGTRTVVATYGGDSTYEFNSTTNNFTVTKRSSQVNVTASATVVGMDAMVNVTIPANATGYVIVNINGTNYAVNTTSGKGSIVIKNLGNGNYAVNVTYIGDDQYFSSTNATDFTILRVQPTFNVNGTDITYGAKELIKFESVENITAPIIVEVDGKNYTSFMINGKGNFTIEGLAAGKHNVTIYFAGNNKYLNATANNTFTVAKAVIPVVVVPQNITYGDVETFTIYVNATGNVTVTIRDDTRNKVDVTYPEIDIDGKLVWDLPGWLAVGNYTVSVEFNGNANYTKNSGSATFNVSKKGPVMTVNVQNITYGDVEHIIVNVNAPGNVTIKVNGTERTIVLKAGEGGKDILRAIVAAITSYDVKATLDVYNLDAGVYPVEVIYNGAENYNKATATAVFYVTKDNTTMDISVEDIKVGGKEIINVTVGNKNTNGTVVINVDGVNYTRPVINGVANLTLTNLSAGNHSVVAIFIDKNYESNWTSTTFNVTKVKSAIAIHVNNTTVGKKALITVDIPENATGFVVIDVDGTKYHVDIAKGQQNVTLEIDNLVNKTYDVTAEYFGDDFYDVASAKGNFNVSKVPSQINITVSHGGIVANGSDVNITIQAPVDATGKVNITIWDGLKNTTYTIYVNDGVGVLHLETPEIGIYDVTAKYLGDDKYLGSENATEFEVYITGKALAVDTEPVTVAQNETIDVWVSGNHVGDNVTIIVKDSQGNVVVEKNTTFAKFYNTNTNMTMANLTLDLLPAGDYTVEAVYIENNGTKLIEHVGTGSFKVSKLPSTITIKEIRNVTVGENAIIELEFGPNEATGNISVFVNGVEYELNTSTLTLTVPKLPAGEYVVHAFYFGDHNYEGSNASATFKVSKLTPSIKVNATNITVGEKVLIEISAPDDLERPILVDVGGVGYYVNITNGKGKLYVPNLASGDYNVTALYMGDDNYTPGNNTASFKVSKVSSTVNVTVENITLGEKAIINIETPKDLCGNVTVSVDGKNHTVFVSGGVGTLVVPDLDVGPHTVNVMFDGCKKYEPSNSTASFEVNKLSNDISVVDQGNGTVVVVVGDNASGNVTIKVGDKEYNATVVNGTAVVQLDGNVTPGTHKVDVIYSGDDNHNASNTTTEIAAPKYPSVVNVTASEVTEGEPLVVTVEVPAGATGNVTVYIDGKEYSGEIKDGIAVVSIDNLTSGDKTYVVEYSGDGNFSANYTIGNVTVKGAKSTPDMVVVDYGNGTVVVVVGDNASGNVTIKVGDKEYNATVVNGTAVVEVGNLTPGKNTVEVIYSGDGTHSNATVNTTIEGPKYETPIIVNVGEAKEGEPVVVTVDVPGDATGEVTVYIDGQEHTVKVDNGTATVVVDNLTAGPKTITVEYSGDGNYTGNYTVSNFTVGEAKVVPELVVVDYGNGTVVVVVGDNASGNVTIKVGDKEYNATVVNGTAVVQLDGNVTPGTHEVDVIYSGDGTHNATSTKANVTAPKYQSVVNVTASEVTEGEPLVVTVGVPAGATGNVTVYIDGKEYSGEIKDGVAVVSIDNLTSGDKTYVVEYSGDGNFSANYTIGNVTVKGAKSTPDMVVVDYGNGTVVVVVGDNATGDVTVKVGNETYTVPVVNGTAVVDIENLTPGKNTVEVIYSGDGTHSNATVSTIINGPKYETPINVTTTSAQVGDDTIIVVSVPEDAKGNVTIEIDGIKYTTNVINGNATFKLNNLTAGTKTIAVEYSGDDNYADGHTTANITLSKVKSSVSAIISDIDVGDNVTITVMVPEDATGQVLIDIDGVGYYVNVTNGIGVTQIPRMPNGIYPVNFTYVGDDKYLPSTNNTVFNVNKIPSFVIPTAKNIAVGDNEIIVFDVPSDATGTLSVVIDGKEFTFDLDEILGVPIYDNGVFTVAVSDGKGVLVLSGLSAGEYNVSVTYNGNYKYLKSANTTVFTVSQRDCDINVVDLGNGTVKVYVSDNATGNITIKVGNQTYSGEIIDGVAVIDLDDVSAGDHDIKVIYSGDDSHPVKTVDSKVSIPKKLTPISVTAHDIYVGDNEHIVVTVPEGASGIITIEINAVPYNATINDGQAVFDIKDLAVGNKTVAVIYRGDDKYVENFTTGQFEVKKLPSTANATSMTITYGNDEIVKIEVPRNATGRVIVKIGEIEYIGTITNGRVNLVIPNLPAGNYEATIIYEGDDKYLPCNTTTSFKVIKSSTPISASGDYIKIGDDGTVTVNLPSDATGTVTIKVDGKTYTQEVIDGKAVFYIPGLVRGVHTVEVYYSGDNNYDANETVTNITVKDDDPVHPVNPQEGDGIDLSKYPTGNPIWILLLVLLAIGSTRLRRFRK